MERETPRELERLARRRNPNDPGLIALGFDGSKGRTRGLADSTALVACRLGDGHLATLGLWEPDREDGSWTPPRKAILATIKELFMTGRVVGFRGDPAGGWGEELARLENTFRPVVWARWPFSVGNRTPAMFDELGDAIRAEKVWLDASDEKLIAHLQAARRIEGKVDKEHTGPNAPRIDLAAAAAYAYRASLEALAARPTKAAKTGRAMFV